MEPEKREGASSAIGRLLCALVGVFAIIRGVETLNPTIQILSMLPAGGWEDGSVLWGAAGALVAPIVLFAMGFLLIRYSPAISARLASGFGDEMLDWEPRAYSIAFLACGVLIVSWALPRLGQVANNLAFSGASEELDSQIRRSGMVMLVWLTVQFILGMCLIVFGRRIVKWQTRPFACRREQAD